LVKKGEGKHCIFQKERNVIAAAIGWGGRGASNVRGGRKGGRVPLKLLEEREGGRDIPLSFDRGR